MFATDCEHPEDGSLDSNLVNLAKDTDILIYDGQYTDKEYDPEKYGENSVPRKGYGHSTASEGVRMAKAVKAKKADQENC